MAARLARLIRELGHLAARIDPLGSEPPGDPGLELSTHGLTARDLERLPASIVGGAADQGAENCKQAILNLFKMYSGSAGYESNHIQDDAERNWFRSAIESRRFFKGITDEDKHELLGRLTEVEAFERFLHQTYIGQKRFSIEGNDVLVPMLDAVIKCTAARGTREVVIGMAHRGRLNVLAHVLGKPYATLLAEFQSAHAATASVSGSGSHGWTGDVKYHQGARLKYSGPGAAEMPVTLVPNPSHLEFVNPVVTGRARAAQERRDLPGLPVQDVAAALAVLIHGDAAFPGQGVVAETLNLSQLNGYKVGGTIHIIANNQIGFTTSPKDARSTLYASDLAKGFEIPIAHVNADDPIACLAISRMACAYREKFGKDFLIDLVGYRRWGHNEGDEPAYTHPRVYKKIAEHPTARAVWANRLIEEGFISKSVPDELYEKAIEHLQAAKTEASESEPVVMPTGLTGLAGAGLDKPTAVAESRLRELNDALLAFPEGFTINPKLDRGFQRRKTALNTTGAIEWALAEALALGTILQDGIPVRFTGQDSQRGTFGQRHIVLHDPKNGDHFNPLQSLPTAKASFAIYNSPLSEIACTGFEYGYSIHAVGVLTLWEAQFGDFSNAAQVIIDQFLVSGAAKWRQTPSLVVLLPHGFEGMGPEHSSARIERYLQLAANGNMRIVNCTTAAQYFHVLRRQALSLGNSPCPLIVFTPKSLLRHPRAGSSLPDLAEGKFHPVLVDRSGDSDREVTRLICCSGKIHVDLVSSDAYPNVTGIATARIEELYPFPHRDIEGIVDRFPNLREVFWMQEEPKNMGGWTFVAPRIRDILDRKIELIYAGREESASTAEGSLSRHVAEQARIIDAALSDIPEPGPKRSTLTHAV